MKLQTIPLNIQTTPTATAQPYKGPQIVRLLDVQLINGHPTMFVLVDETKVENCDQFVLRVNQPFDKSVHDINGNPIDQANMPAILKSANGTALLHDPVNGYYIVASYCFGGGA